MPFRDPPPPPKPPSLPGASRPAPVPGRAPVRPPAIAPAAAAAAATAAEQNAVTASLSRPRKWRKMRRNETIFALAAVAGCLVAGGIAALVIGTDVSAGGPKRSRAGSTMRSHGTAAHAEGDGRRADGDGRRAAPAAVSHFAAIGTELQHNRHLPLQGLDGGDSRRQRAELCTVGNVPISLRLPADKVQLLPDGPPSVLECRPDGDQSWTFVSVTAGRDRRCGGAAVERGMLTAWIDVRESVTVPGHVEQWRAREALARERARGAQGSRGARAARGPAQGGQGATRGTRAAEPVSQREPLLNLSQNGVSGGVSGAVWDSLGVQGSLGVPGNRRSTQWSVSEGL